VNAAPTALAVSAPAAAVPAAAVAIATVLPFPTVRTPEPAPAPGGRLTRGCGGQPEERGAHVRPAGLCVVCGRITLHRHPDGLALCAGATLPTRLEAAAR